MQQLRQAKSFIEKNGDSLFTWMHRGTDDHRPKTPYRARFKRLVDELGKPLACDAATDCLERTGSDATERLKASIEYMILPEQFRTEICKGHDYKAVTKLLRDRGCLLSERNKLTNKYRVPGAGKPVPVFHLTAKILEIELS